LKFVHAIGEYTNARLMKYVERNFGCTEEGMVTEALSYIINKFLDKEEAID